MYYPRVWLDGFASFHVLDPTLDSTAVWFEVMDLHARCLYARQFLLT